MAKNEISEKLSKEILAIIDKAEKFSDRKARQGRNQKYDVDPDWMINSCWWHELRAHLYWHMEQKGTRDD